MTIDEKQYYSVAEFMAKYHFNSRQRAWQVIKANNIKTIDFKGLTLINKEWIPSKITERIAYNSLDAE